MQNLQPTITVDNISETSTPAGKPKIDDEQLKSGITEIKKAQSNQKIERWEMKKVKLPIAILAGVGAVALGIASGLSLKTLVENRSLAQTYESPATQQVAGDSVKAGDIFGSNHEVFKDVAEGYLEQGGINGEGSHKLLRTGGDSQTVYLTSSVTDLDKLSGMQVKVWGETYQGQKAGWLMDVGKIEVIDPNASSPELTQE
ncbi:MAG TPA: hypothetical protein PKX78_04345 [Candidatus Woesebacteria bacterium]|nr:hypothetical protein [Candidatus Woesebacteria bacterium]